MSICQNQSGHRSWWGVALTDKFANTVLNLVILANFSHSISAKIQSCFLDFSRYVLSLLLKTYENISSSHYCYYEKITLFLGQ